MAVLISNKLFSIFVHIYCKVGNIKQCGVSTIITDNNKMKKNNLIYAMMMLASILMIGTFNASAQDVVKTNPKYTKMLTDTAGVRMIKVTLAPGEEMIMHTHPVQMMYCLEGGQITVNYQSGKKESYDLKAGDAFQAPADPPHTTKNTGTTTVSFLEIEIGGMKK